MGLFGNNKKYALQDVLLTVNEVDKAKERGDIFVIKDIQNFASREFEDFLYILVHLETGVNYAYRYCNQLNRGGNSLTALIDTDGKPLITKL